jgi:peptide/nickel transport system ATP-binding protein
MTALLEIADLSVDFPLSRGLMSFLHRGPAPALNILDGISLSMQPGETLGIVGESGSGKTTLARALLGLTPISSGSVSFDGRGLKSANDFAGLRSTVAMMFQDAVASLSPRMKVSSLVTEPFAIHGVPIADRRAKAKDMLEQVGLLPSLVDRYPHELSGGQARRVGVARALALSPRLVIADEPTAGLDVSVQGEILNLMNDLKKRSNLSYLMITHNLALVRHVTTSVAVMYLGRLVETGPTRSIFAQPLHPYTRSLLASEPQPDPRKRRKDLAIKGEVPSLLARPKGCEFHTRCPLAAERCRSETPQLRDLGQDRKVKCHFAEQQH